MENDQDICPEGVQINLWLSYPDPVVANKVSRTRHLQRDLFGYANAGELKLLFDVSA